MVLNLQKFNDTADEKDDFATVSMYEREPILTTTEGWSIAISGFSIDLSRSFYYQEADPTVHITHRRGIKTPIGQADMLKSIEVGTATRRTYSFQQFMQQLAPKVERETYGAMLPNASGGVRFTTPQSNQGAEYEQPLGDDEYVSFQFSKDAAVKLGIEGAFIHRPETQLYVVSDIVTETLSRMPTYLKTLPELACHGTIIVDYDGSTEDILHFQLEDNICANLAAPITYGPLNFSINYAAFLQQPTVIETQTMRCRMAVLSQGGENQFLTLHLYHPMQQVVILASGNVQVWCENPIVKTIAQCYNDALIPQIQVTRTGNASVIFTTKGAYQEFLGNFPELKSDQVFIEAFQNDLQPLSPSWEGTTDEGQAERVIATIDRTVFLDSHGGPIHVDNPWDVDTPYSSVELDFWNIRNYAGTRKNVPVILGSQVLISRAFFAFQELLGIGTTINLPYEQTYLINHGDFDRMNYGFRDFIDSDDYTVNSNYADTPTDDLMFCLLATEYYIKNSLAAISDNHSAICKAIMTNIKAAEPQLPGIDPIDMDYNVVFSGGDALQQTIDMTDPHVVHVKNSTFTSNAPILANFGKRIGDEPEDDSRAFILGTAISAANIAAYNDRPGQRLVLTREDSDGDVQQVRAHFSEYVGGEFRIVVGATEIENGVEIHNGDFDEFFEDGEYDRAGLPLIDGSVGAPHTSFIGCAIGDNDDFYGRLRERVGNYSFTVEHSKEIKLYSNHYIEKRYGIADTLATFSSIAIVSSDLLINPVISSGFKEAVLHQYPLPNSYGIGFDDDWSPNGSSHTPPGTLSWRTRGYLLPHKIVMGNASLQRFSISATLRHKNPALGSVKILLPPHGEFALAAMLFRNIHA